MAALKYWVWLTNVPGLTNHSRWLLLEHFHSPEEIYYAQEEQILLRSEEHTSELQSQ